MKRSCTYLKYLSTVTAIVFLFLLKNTATSEILPGNTTPASIQLSNQNLLIIKETDESPGLHHVQGIGTHESYYEVIFTLATIASPLVREGGCSTYASLATGSVEKFDC
jgi:hypothetical protein